MILPFSTQFNGKPNYFIEKIWEGLFRSSDDDTMSDLFKEYIDKYEARFGHRWDEIPDSTPRMNYPKIHTIRKDETERWEEGKNIHFYINNRSKNAFQFAPVLPVVSIESIFITYRPHTLEITVGDRYLYDHTEKLRLAYNDGFESWNEFFDFFYNAIEENKKIDSNKAWFSGKIIHWTNFRY